MPDRAELDRFIDGIDYPMFIVTATESAVGGPSPAGCLVGFVTQCSIDPARLLVCISKANHTYDVAREASHLGVHLLRSDQRWLAELFGVETEDRSDKFAHCSWRWGSHDVPLVNDCPRWLIGEIGDRIDLGDHVGFLITPFEASDGELLSPLTFQQVRDLEAGHPA